MENKITLKERIEEDLHAELAAINTELSDVEELFTENKTFYDGIRNSRNVRNLTFLANQLANLVSLKNNKLSLIKTRLDVKHKTINNLLRLEALESSEGGENSLPQELLTLLMDKIPNSSTNYVIEAKEVSESDVDAQLDVILASNDESEDTNVEDEEDGGDSSDTHELVAYFDIYDKLQWLVVDGENTEQDMYELPDELPKLHPSKDGFVLDTTNAEFRVIDLHTITFTS